MRRRGGSLYGREKRDVDEGTSCRSIATGPDDVKAEYRRPYDAILFDFCRDDDYVAIFMEIQQRLMRKATPL